jgi:AraC-like DNA-binding protein
MEGCHQHNDVEINYLERGRYTYLHGGTMVEVVPQAILVFWAGRPHQVVAVEPHSHLWGISLPLPWVLDWRLPTRFIRRLLNGDVMRPRDSAPQRTLPFMIPQWLEDLSADTAETRTTMLLEIEGWLRRVAAGLEDEPGEDTHHDADAPESVRKVKDMARYISEHYKEPISVQRVARMVQLHPNYAVRLFRKQTGSTLIDFITRQRLAHAQMMLATTDASVLDVGFESGFGSASRFYAAFKSAFSMSPSDYRRVIHVARPRNEQAS